MTKNIILRSSSFTVCLFQISLLLLAVVFSVSSSSTLFAEEQQENFSDLFTSDLTYQGQISLLDMCLPDSEFSQEANASYEQFNLLLEEWEEEHTGIIIEEKQIRRYVDVSALTVIGRLPDIFLLDCISTRRYAKRGIIVDLDTFFPDGLQDEQDDTQENLQNESQDGLDVTGYDPVLLEPFRVDGNLYALPALTANEMIVVYDSVAFENCGIDGFPESWAESLKTNQLFKEDRYQGLLAYAAKSKTNMIRDVLSPLAICHGAVDWLEEMRNYQDAMCTDQLWLDILDTFQKLLNNGVFGKECLEMDADAAMKAFVNGKYPAVWLPLSNVYELLDDLKKTLPDMYDRIRFARFPLSGNDDGMDSSEKPGRYAWMSYGLVINRNVLADPDKLKACIDLCLYLTGSEYARKLVEEWGAKCAWITEESVTSVPSDETLERLMILLNDETETAPVLTQYLESQVWEACAKYLPDMISKAESLEMMTNQPEKSTEAIPSKQFSTDYITTEEIAYSMQDAYERYYLSVSDFSELAELIE